MFNNMRFRWSRRTITYLSLLLLFVVFAVSVSSYASRRSDVDLLETKTNNLEQRVEDLKAELERARLAVKVHVEAEGKTCGDESDIERCLSGLAVLPKEQPKGSRDIVAETVDTIEARRRFTLPDRPGVALEIVRVSRAAGGVDVPECRASGNTGSRFIFAKGGDSSSPGICLDTQRVSIEGQAAALFVVELKIANNSSDYLGGKFLAAFYSVETSAASEDRLAKDDSPRTLSIAPSSSRIVRIGFEIPESQNEVRLVYGNFGGGEGTGESFFEKSAGGFLIDFERQTFSDLPG